MTRKILCAVLTLVLAFTLTGCAYCEDPDNVGLLTRLRTTPEEFYALMKQSWSVNGWEIMGGDHSTSRPKFYDTLMLMQMALSRNEIQEMILPDFVGEYLLKVNQDYSQCCVSNSENMNLCFGFLKDNHTLRARWNAALNAMKSDNTLSNLEYKYARNVQDLNKHDKDKSIVFTKYDGAPIVKVAVTGDLPPVDFVDEYGLPAGYSLAVLSEIGRRLRVNVRPIVVSAGARAASLVSGRADVVFWYEINESYTIQPDVPDGIILSVPYLAWNKFIHVRFDDDGE